MADNKIYDVDAILDELQAKAKQQAEEEEIVVPKKPVFELHLDLDSEYGEATDVAPIVVREEVIEEQKESPKPIEKSTPVPDVHKPKRKLNERDEMSIGCLKAFIYAVGVLVLSVGIAVFGSVFFFDYTGLGR